MEVLPTVVVAVLLFLISFIILTCLLCMRRSRMKEKQANGKAPVIFPTEMKWKRDEYNFISSVKTPSFDTKETDCDLKEVFFYCLTFGLFYAL